MRLYYKDVRGYSADFEFTFQYNQCIEIEGKLRQENIQGIYFEIFNGLSHRKIYNPD